MAKHPVGNIFLMMAIKWAIIYGVSKSIQKAVAEK